MARLFERIKQALRNILPKLPVFREEPGVPGEPEEELAEPVRRATYLQEAEIMHIIKQSAQRRTLLWMLYNNQWRHVEPYSFRDGKQGLLLYGHCLIHNDTHSFYVHRIQELQLTDIPYNPRWYVEIA
jgi:predicted DNA-binding transcriptional regulator YafY